MRPRRFDELSERVRAGTATSDELKEFVDHAIDLRLELIYYVNIKDDWDKDQACFGFEPYSDDGDEVYSDLMEWNKSMVGSK